MSSWDQWMNRGVRQAKRGLSNLDLTVGGVRVMTRDRVRRKTPPGRCRYVRVGT